MYLKSSSAEEAGKRWTCYFRLNWWTTQGLWRQNIPAQEQKKDILYSTDMFLKSYKVLYISAFPLASDDDS